MTPTQTALRPTGTAARSGSWYASFTDAAHRDPDAPALEDPAAPATALTHGALVERVEGLAGALRAAGVDPRRGEDVVVAVAVGRSVDAVVAMLAVLAVGAAYLPVDPAAPAARTADALARLDVRVAVADGAGHAALPATVRALAPRASVPGWTWSAPDPDALAYVLHTSGSTGVPKAVAMTQRGLDRLIAWQVADGPRALRTVQFTATGFDVTFQEVLSTIATGGCLVVASDRARRDPDALLDLLLDQRVQRVFLPYVALQLLAVAAARRGVTVATLEHVVTAGERLIATPAVRAFLGAVPGCRLDNHYGPTEAHLATRYTLRGAAAAWPELPPIGTPVAGVACAVLDDDLRPVAEGEVGELHLGGTGLARGYLRDGARTAERFVADPAGSGHRLYRTGDLVRPGTDGYEFVGRTDGQLKVRGYRVEPAEIEHALLHHPAVDAVAVAVRELAPGVPALVAYVQASAPVPHHVLADHLRTRLPGHLVPARFVPVGGLPRTTTGKVDLTALAALPLPDPAGPPPAPVDAPTPAVGGPDVAATVAAVWRRVLGHDEFDEDDDFFDIGGDSLLATWVLTELERELGASPGLSVFLDDSTVAGLAAALASAGAAGADAGPSSELLTLRPGPSAHTLHLVHPLGGELLAYRELARASTAPFRLVGVGWTGGPPSPGTTLEQLAATHVAHLRAVQPEGPYLLAGWSFGGVLAFEMARQFRAAGDAVDLLAMIDANPVLDPLTGLPMAETPFRAMLDDLLARLDGPTGADAAAVAAITSGPEWTQLMGAPLRSEVSTGYLRTVLVTARACMDAAMRYRPRPCDAPVTLLQPDGSDPDRQVRLAAALRGLCTGPFTAVAVGGDHRSVVHAPDVEETARVLDAALEHAGAETAGVDDGS